MIRSRAIPVVIAVLSISALGVAATTLETTLTADPDEVIDMDSDRVPIGQGSAETLLEEVNSGGDEAGEPSEAGDGSAEAAVDDGSPETTGSGDGDAGDRTDPPESGDTGDEIDPSGSGDGPEGSTGAVAGENAGSGSGAGAEGETGVPRPFLATVLQVLLVVVLAALAYRYHGALLSALGRRSADVAPETSEASGSDTNPWPGASPSNVVDRAWLAMIQRIEPERPETATPTECVALARDRGADVEAVEAIAMAFERVHYGGVSAVTEESRAREGLRRIDEGDTHRTGGEDVGRISEGDA